MKSAPKHVWNLKQLYESHTDPRIEKDMRTSERAYMAFEKKYKGTRVTKYLSNESALLEALNEYTGIFEHNPIAKPLVYFFLTLDLDSRDDNARAKFNVLMERCTQNEIKVAFFELSLGTLDEAKQAKFLASKKLAHYHYFLKNIFDRAKHDLSEAEEKIMSLKGLPAHERWVSMTEKILGKATVLFEGKNMPISEAMYRIADLPKKDRYELHDAVMAVLEKTDIVAESEINALVLNKKIDDELRGYKHPQDATIEGYQNDAKSIKVLVDTVTKHFHVSQRFYALKAKILGSKKLRYPDRNVGIGKGPLKKVTFAESVEILREVFGALDPQYRSILDSFLEDGQIDAHPKVGKSGGAYCAGNTHLPTFVLLNHTDTLEQVSTFAHEMGHAIHTELSKSQPVIYQGYSTSTAEVASTLFESFVFDALFEKLSDTEKVEALHRKISDDIQTIFRQIACFNFEEEMHNTIREKGALSASELRLLMNKHMSSYLGPTFDMKESDGNFFVSWSHIRRFFYVYSYAFGQLVSKALYVNYKKDKKYLEKIESFLKAGGSDSPENIFKSIGIDVTKPSFWKQGIESIERDIDVLEKLTGKLTKKGGR